jgi:hypothetical protein
MMNGATLPHRDSFKKGPKLHGKDDKFHLHNVVKLSALLGQKVFELARKNNKGVMTNLRTSGSCGNIMRFILKMKIGKSLLLGCGHFVCASHATLVAPSNLVLWPPEAHD